MQVMMGGVWAEGLGSWSFSAPCQLGRAERPPCSMTTHFGVSVSHLSNRAHTHTHTPARTHAHPRTHPRTHLPCQGGEDKWGNTPKMIKSWGNSPAKSSLSIFFLNDSFIKSGVPSVHENLS